jgi:hypothetical protein
MAKLAPSTANASGIHTLRGSEKALHASTMAVTAPASGVHNPGDRKEPGDARVLDQIRTRMFDFEGEVLDALSNHG